MRRRGEVRARKASEPFGVAAGFWWRFSRYELRGEYLRPAPGATFTWYDPWEAYRAARTQGIGADTLPYQSLLNLLEELNLPLQVRELPWRSLSPTTTEKLLGWCAAYGLLGMLLQRVLMAHLVPRWEPLETDQAQRKGTVPLWPVQWSYMRTSSGWRARRLWELTRRGRDRRTRPQRGQPVAEKSRSARERHPSVLLQDLETGEWVQESIGATWAKFFPGVPPTKRETYLYPAPLSDEFCVMYAEPVEEFLKGALALREAVSSLAHLKPWEAASALDRLRMTEARDLLNRLVAPVSSTLMLRRDGTVQQRWVAPSLLASLAMMVFQDVSEQRKVLSCENVTCRRLFVATAWQARYCSKRCRFTVQKRRYRGGRKRPGHVKVRGLRNTRSVRKDVKRSADGC